MDYMNKVIPFLDNFVIVFIDDILIYSKTQKKHVKHIKTTLNILSENQSYVKLLKCNFG